MSKTVSPEQQTLKLDEFETIETASLILVDEAVEKLVRTPRGVIVVIGHSGVGKNFAVERAVAKQSITVVNASFTSHSGRNDVYGVILQQLVGEVPSGENYHLRHRTRRELHDRPALLIVRRAERIKRAVMDEIEWLFDD